LPTFTYKDVRMIVAEPDAVFAGNIIDALMSRGIREPNICRSAEALQTALTGSPDLIICDVDLPGLDICATAQDIRHGRLGKNPFAVVIATARPSTSTDLNKVMQSGIDYIVLKPMTADQVLRRVDGFTRSRKPFVVTEDFIGPSRRTRRRDDGSDDDCTPVPNTLRIKVLHNNRLSMLNKVLEIGLARMSKKRNETQVKSVSRLTKRLVEMHTQATVAGTGLAMADWRRALAVLVEKSDAVVAAHKGSSHTDHVGEIAVRINQLAKRWSDINDRPPSIEMVLVAQLSDALIGASAQNEDVPEIAREIAAVVDNFLAKEEAAGAAAGEGEA
jgi:DNA-binding response OmpR family regulator